MTPLEFLATVPPGAWVSQSQYLYYGSLAGHAIGMGVVVGGVYALTARVLGFSKQLQIETFERLFPIMASAFFLNLVTGVLLFTANGNNLAKNAPFLIKITLVVVSGILTLSATRAVGRSQPLQSEFSSSAKILCVLAATGWTMAIMAGRIIAYTIEY